MYRTDEIHTLTEFQRNTKDYIERLKQTQRPELLTVHGKPEVVIQDAEAYQRLLDVLDRAEAIVGVQRGLPLDGSCAPRSGESTYLHHDLIASRPNYIMVAIQAAVSQT